MENLYSEDGDDAGSAGQRWYMCAEVAAEATENTATEFRL